MYTFLFYITGTILLFTVATAIAEFLEMFIW